MSTIKSEFKLKRSLEMENSAASSIVELFTVSWEETAKKSPREIMALVLLTMKDACQVFHSTDETEEHLQLLHAGQYFDKLIQALESSGPLPVVIVGNTFNDMLRNLDSIKKHAENEEYGKDITDRIDLFVRKCTKMSTEILHNEKSNKISRLVIGGVVGALLGVLVRLLIEGNLEDFSGGDILVIIIWIVGCMAFSLRHG